MISILKKFKFDGDSWWKSPLVLVLNYFALMFALLPFMSTLSLTGKVFLDYLVNTGIAFSVVYLCNALCLSTLNAELDNMITIRHYFSIKYLVQIPFFIAFGLIGLLSYFNAILFLVIGVISFVFVVMLSQVITIKYFENMYPNEGNRFKKIMLVYSVIYLSILLIGYAII